MLSQSAETPMASQPTWQFRNRSQEKLAKVRNIAANEAIDFASAPPVGPAPSAIMTAREKRNPKKVDIAKDYLPHEEIEHLLQTYEKRQPTPTSITDYP